MMFFMPYLETIPGGSSMTDANRERDPFQAMKPMVASGGSHAYK